MLQVVQMVHKEAMMIIKDYEIKANFPTYEVKDDSCEKVAVQSFFGIDYVCKNEECEKCQKKS